MTLLCTLVKRSALAFSLALAATAALAQGGPAAACPPQATMPDARAMQAFAEQASDRGLLWRATKNGRSLHLYGTLHAGRAAWMFPGPKLRAALDASDTLALELDLSNPQVMGELQAGMAAVPHPPLSPERRARLARQTAAACLPEGALAALHPVMQAITLSLLAGRWEQLDPAFSLEAGLIGFAGARKMPVVSLETPADQIPALLPADPAQALDALDQALDQLEDGRARRVLRRMGQAWEAGHLQDLQAYEAWCECIRNEADREQLRRLNDARNGPLARRIDALHGEGRRLMVAVGALHMTGPQALPALLAGLGYEVERLFP